MKTNLGSNAAAPRESLRQRLQSELARRCNANPQYSLRAFALDVGVDHSTLSQILRGKRALTSAMIERLGAALKLPDSDIASFIAAEKLVASVADLAAVEQLAHDVAAAISDGCHYAILELVRLESFRPDSRWIARVLGVNVDEVNMALQRLLRLGLLEMTEPERWTALCGDTVANHEGFAHAALEKLAQAVRAIDPMSRALRDHSSTTLAVDTRSLPGALALLARARREIVEFLERDGPRDDVYRLEMHLFPLTRLNAENESNDGPTRDALPNPGATPR